VQSTGSPWYNWVMDQKDFSGGKCADEQPKFHTLQLFVWQTPAKELLIDIYEAGAAHARIIKDVASTHITSGKGEHLELYAFDGETNAPETKSLGTWTVIWDMPERCRLERPCVIVEGACIDLVKFVQARS